MEGRRRPPRVRGLRREPRQLCFEAVGVEELCTDARRLPVGERERKRVVPCRLAVRPGRRRLAPRGRGVLEHGGDVGGALRVVREPRGDPCLPASRAEGLEHGSVQSPTPRQGDGVLEDESRELVPEGDRQAVLPQHSRREARVEVLGRVGRDRLEQPELRPARNECDHLEEATGVGAERRGARQHRVPDRLGQLRRPDREDLGHVERVAVGQCVDRVAVGAARLGERAHGGEREARHGEPRDAGRGRELTEDDAQRMAAVNLVVTVGRDDEPPRPVDPPTEHAQGVERRLVRPVDVLEDDERGLPELVEEGSRHRSRIRPLPERLREGAAPCRREVDEGTERRGRGEALARADEHRAPGPVGEGTHERRLPDARLAADEHEPAARVERLGERREQVVALEHIAHVRNVPRRAPSRQAAARPRSVARLRNLGDSADSAARAPA